MVTHILKLVTKLTSMVSFTLQPLYCLRNILVYLRSEDEGQN
jgi:hypothetical protein